MKKPMSSRKAALLRMVVSAFFLLIPYASYFLSELLAAVLYRLAEYRYTFTYQQFRTDMGEVSIYWTSYGFAFLWLALLPAFIGFFMWLRKATWLRFALPAVYALFWAWFFLNFASIEEFGMQMAFRHYPPLYDSCPAWIKMLYQLTIPALTQLP